MDKMMSFKLKSKNAFQPRKNYFREVGFELYSSEEILIPAKKRKLIETDLSFTFPFGYYGLLVSIPEIASEHLIDVSCTPLENEIDSVKVLLINNSECDFMINKGDRIALLIVNKYYDNMIIFENNI